MFYVLEALDTPGSEAINAGWKYATTRTFDSLAAAALFMATSALNAANEGRFNAYKIEPKGD